MKRKAKGSNPQPDGRTLPELIAFLTEIAEGLKKFPRDEFDRGAVTALESCISVMKTLKGDKNGKKE